MKIHESQDLVDIQYMKRALALACRGMGTVSPNPMVGAVIVKDNVILGEGWHIRAGEPHAEPNAISDCEESCVGATIYVTLEPCCHTKKRTPPCTSALIVHKFKRVVIATLDPNPSVAGNGVKALEAAGIEVEYGLLENQAQKLNEIFFKNIITKTPFVMLKMAQTLDGKLSTLSGDSKWITDESARILVHKMRLQYDAVMVGRKTLNHDDPSLSIRMGIDAKGKTPLRIVVGNICEMDLSRKLFIDDHANKTIIVTSTTNYEKISKENFDQLKNKQVRIISCAESGGKIDFDQAMKLLGELGITSILVEGGGTLASSLLEAGLVDKLTVFVAPKILGQGISYFNKTLDEMSEALTFKNIKLSTLGNQAIFEMYPE